MLASASSDPSDESVDRCYWSEPCFLYAGVSRSSARLCTGSADTLRSLYDETSTRCHSVWNIYLGVDLNKYIFRILDSIKPVEKHIP